MKLVTGYPFSDDRILSLKGKEPSEDFNPQKIGVRNVKMNCPEGWKEIHIVFDISETDNLFPCDEIYHLQQPSVNRYEGMLEIPGYEVSVTGIAGRTKGSMTLGLSFLEEHKPWGRKGKWMEFDLDGLTIRVE